jgi:hypothetical protein
VSDGVPEAAHFVHDRHGAVVHGVELVQTARLEARRHHQNVSPRGEPVRELVRKPDPRANLVVVPLLHAHQLVLQIASSGPEEHHLHVLVREEVLVL